ncbi:MAG TPA: NAD(+) synthase [Paludibacter sp.]|jgi:NAD+ synthase (glutamine-hydrolysing)|nr:MAG: Glutamine-dependent NAD(+) synthetase [Bacteroidetes bacterium ADurb.Bin174]HQB27528.1 NAD(+) synthase [Paludibacter sp.]
MNYGFVRVAAAVPVVKIADCSFNSLQVSLLMEQAEKEKAEIISFPELSITGYTCADLFFQQQLLTDAENTLRDLLLKTYSLNIIAIVGMPLRVQSRLYNVAVVIQSGKVLGIVPKSYLPNNNEFSECRWFASGMSDEVKTLNFNETEVPFGTNLLFNYQDSLFGVEICKDLCVPIPPSTQHCMHGADMIFNLSASNELVGKHPYRRKLVEVHSAKCKSAYIYASSGFGESSTDVVFGGSCLIAENGRIIASNATRFSMESELLITEIDTEKLRSEKLKDLNFFQAKSSANYQIIPCKSSNYKFDNLRRTIKRHPFIPSESNKNSYYQEILSIQVQALAQRWTHTQTETLVLGISGGLDSTLALLVCLKTAEKLGYDRKRIVGIIMPGFGTTGRSQHNANKLITSLGITNYAISVKEACLQHFKDIGHDKDTHDITFENVQARERTQILMDMANKLNGLVIGTGDLSESALGWSTYNGDHMSMYAINSGVPKTLIRHLLGWMSNQFDSEAQSVLQDIINSPISPELLPPAHDGTTSQKTEDAVGPYELHDFFLYYFVRYGFTPEKIRFLAQQAFKKTYSFEEITKWLKLFLKRFFSQQFKRSCMPDGPKISSVSLSPRGDWKMPSDVKGFNLE